MSSSVNTPFANLSALPSDARRVLEFDAERVDDVARFLLASAEELCAVLTPEERQDQEWKASLPRHVSGRYTLTDPQTLYPVAMRNRGDVVIDLVKFHMHRYCGFYMKPATDLPQPFTWELVFPNYSNVGHSAYSIGEGAVAEHARGWQSFSTPPYGVPTIDRTKTTPLSEPDEKLLRAAHRLLEIRQALPAVPTLDPKKFY